VTLAEQAALHMPSMTADRPRHRRGALYVCSSRVGRRWTRWLMARCERVYVFYDLPDGSVAYEPWSR
jgi:hypothetical protein